MSCENLHGMAAVDDHIAFGTVQNLVLLGEYRDELPTTKDT
jgi:hypothetical protein